jgi:mono/diheme cytochrome c family protein
MGGEVQTGRSNCNLPEQHSNISTTGSRMPMPSQSRSSLLMLILAGVLLAACGKSEPEVATEATPAAQAPANTSPAAAAAPSPGEQAAARGVAPDSAAPAPSGPPTPIPQIAAIEATPARIDAGKKLYFSAGCNACHGGTGGGGMCPALTNDVWVYGADESTLHALLKEGSAAMQGTHGLKRVGVEKVVGLMPPFGSVLTDEEINDVIAYIHSIHPTMGKAAEPKAGATGAK